VTPSEQRPKALQANDINKVLEFPFRVAEGLNNSRAIAAHFGFDKRQSSYYRDAAETLGAVVLRKGTYELTDRGREYIRLPPDQRNQYFLRLVLELPIMHEVFLRVVQAGRGGLGKDEIAELIGELTRLTRSTRSRRAETVIAWYRWIEQALGIVRVHRNRIYVRGLEWF